jgi:hypothetical protein
MGLTHDPGVINSRVYLPAKEEFTLRFLNRISHRYPYATFAVRWWLCNPFGCRATKDSLVDGVRSSPLITASGLETIMAGLRPSVPPTVIKLLKAKYVR